MSDKSARIHDFASFRKSREKVDPMSALAAEMQGIVFRAAEPLSARDSLKGRLARAHEALQKAIPARELKFWRVRAAWQGDAGVWVGQAHEDLRERDRVLSAKVEAARGKARNLGDLYASIAAHLVQSDPDFHSISVASLLDAARALGAGNSSLAPTDGDGE